MVKRLCLDCPIPNCGAKYLVKLPNHLADVHHLDCIQQRTWLQEAKLQPGNLDDREGSDLFQESKVSHGTDSSQEETEEIEHLDP